MISNSRRMLVAVSAMAVALCAPALIVTTTASAQADFEFQEAAEPAAVPQQATISPADVAALDAADAAFARDDFENASIQYWQVLADDPAATDPATSRAQFGIARSLVRMGLLQGALLFFDEIVARGPQHPHFQESAPWMVLIARRLPGDTEMLRRVSVFAELFPDRVEDKYRDEMAYMLGQHFYNVGDLERALQYLDVVAQTSDFYPRSLFLAAITNVRSYDAQPAVNSLRELLVLSEQSRGSDEEMQKLGDLARITLARTFYSTGEYDKALQHYGAIEQADAYWLEAIFESSWAYFQTDEYNRALGNLHSLNSPFFNDRYYPEAPILQAVIFFYNCRFEEVRLIIDEFNYVYVPLREELQITLDGLFSDEDAFNFLRDADARAETEKGFDPRLSQIVAATLSDRSLVDSLAFIDQLDREAAYIEGDATSWTGTELADYVYGEIVAIRELSIGDAGSLVRGRLETILRELQEKEREASAILVETDLAEANAISAGLRGELAGAGGAADGEPREVHPEQMFWTFDGEYWRDELGYYSYHVASRCQDGE